MKVGTNTVVTMDYELRVDGFEGELVESSIESGTPITFIYGKGMIIPAIEEAIAEKEAGDVVKLEIPPEQAYGERNEEAVQKIPRHFIPPHIELKEGLTLVMQTPQGEEIGMKVLEFNDEEVTVDLNHPLAGKTLYFTLYLKEVREASPEELLELAQQQGMQEQ
ncbi:FKBP-type peptidyl-prolyl cis-trans isomerase SlyD [Thermosulfidibacter takaii ABI70S6]|uniref:Peptidyl-prolyl cis-trans isomerase n=1 Tax=Thermosulfidibacter takaii (strain DSM 17441 / JCM 13301 / NBRC 103674 / ABI70S6) TaxID=1298851 RepID=A0A0S3QS23_THET7|nr:peptidylprolyl isomerase [Thermosulfidibacter takaii]BAT71101.1 FKBP-type peptidyl-prolyl cis-trans isomerase SlyD [Thermosulfidibacter takaii ABI70S6]